MDLLVNYGIRASSLAPAIPAYELLYDSETEGVSFPTTQIDITGLNITKDDEIQLVYTLVGSTTDSSLIWFFPNDQTNNTHYVRQIANTQSSTYSSSREVNADSWVVFTRSNLRSEGYADIKIGNDNRIAIKNYYLWGFGSTGVNLYHTNLFSAGIGFTLTNITKLTIFCNRTNGIATGSRIQLFKVN